METLFRYKEFRQQIKGIMGVWKMNGKGRDEESLSIPVKNSTNTGLTKKTEFSSSISTFFI